MSYISRNKFPALNGSESRFILLTSPCKDDIKSTFKIHKLALRPFLSTALKVLNILRVLAKKIFDECINYTKRLEMAVFCKDIFKGGAYIQTGCCH